MTRHPSEGGYACGEDTRRRILEVAIAAFGEGGYEGASTRAIAQQAESNIAAIQYYFGGKEGLYRACAEYVVAQAWEGASETHRRLVEADAKQGREHLIELLCDGFESIAQFMYGSDKTKNWALFMMREQVRPTTSAAFNSIYEGLQRPLIEQWSRLIGLLMGQPADAPEVLLRTSLILAQVLGMRVTSQTALRTLQWPDFGKDRLPIWLKALRSQVRAVLLTPPGPL
jgi:AcrR family transcriptional regulator